MLRIKPEIDKKILEEKYGFKKCKRPYQMLLYKCFADGGHVMFIGDGIFIVEWDLDDPRIHERPNCSYRSQDTSEKVLFDLISDNLVEFINDGVLSFML